jgi:hypothetical protein
LGPIRDLGAHQRLFDLSVIKPKKTFFLNEIDALLCCKEVFEFSSALITTQQLKRLHFFCEFKFFGSFWKLLVGASSTPPKFFWSMKSFENPKVISNMNCFERSFQKKTYTNPISWRNLLINTITNSFVELFGVLHNIEKL